MPKGSRPAAPRRRARWRSDEAMVFAAIVLSALPYVATIGFYSDDWAFLHVYESLRPGGAAEVLRSGLETPLKERPLHGLYNATLFLLFGADPLPHHLVNTALLALSGALLFKLLRDCDVPRDLAFATAILFGFLPQLTTLRVWYATFQIVLSLVLFLCSALLEIRFARRGGAGIKVLALVCAACSLLAYETTAPLLAAVALGGAWIGRQRGLRWPVALGWSLPNLLLVAAVLAAKWAVTERMLEPVGLGSELRRIFWTFWDWGYDWSTRDGLNLRAALSVNFWHSFVDEAKSLLRVWFIPHGLAIAALSAAIGVAVFARLPSASAPIRRRFLLVYIAAGLAAFWLGYAVFFLSTMVHFAPTSTGNRMATPASIGIAMILAGFARLMADALGGARRPLLFAALVAAPVVAGSIHASVVAAHWARAWATETAILDRAGRDLAGIPAEATVVLGGVCPYDGPAIVFESAWDWNSAASIRLGRHIRGDVAIPSLQLTPEGLSTQIYDMRNSYPYGPVLYVYEPARRLLTPIRDAGTANAYRPRHLADRAACPRGFPAMGVLDW